MGKTAEFVTMSSIVNIADIFISNQSTFINTRINEKYHGQSLVPHHSLKPKMDCKNGKTKYLPPALLEEGFVEFKEKDRHPFKFPSNETTKFQISSNSFLDSYETEETDIIHELQREGRIDSD